MWEDIKNKNRSDRRKDASVSGDLGRRPRRFHLRRGFIPSFLEFGVRGVGDCPEKLSKRRRFDFIGFGFNLSIKTSVH
jgi:hypothetical protein